MQAGHWRAHPKANTYRWTSTSQATTTSSATSAGHEVAADIASVARMWVAATYDDLRRAGPDRATQLRRILDSYVLPWFGPRTSTVCDITYFMIHDWLPTLVGRRRGEPDDHERRIARPEVSMAEGERSLREAARMSEVSLATALRGLQGLAWPAGVGVTANWACSSARPCGRWNATLLL